MITAAPTAATGQQLFQMAFLMELFITPDGDNTQGVLRAGRMRLPCVFGRCGLNADKREGDHTTPIGTFSLRRVLFRPDRMKVPPLTGLPTAQLCSSDGWCDDPAHHDYNTRVTLPHPARCESLWREDSSYDIIVVVGYNDLPPKPGLGSAIFMHIAHRCEDGSSGFRPTEGCVALSAHDLLAVLAVCTHQTRLTIHP